MKISIIMAAYNAANTIGSAIGSVLEQSHQDWELLVVDGASRDGTAAVASAFRDRRIVVRSEPDRGIYDAMNKGLSGFTGDAAGFLNSDDRFHDAGALAAIADALRDHDVVHGHLDFVAPGTAHKVVRRWRATDYRPGAFRRGWMPAHPTCYMRREVIARTGLFDPGMKIGADYDYMLRAIEDRGVRVGLVDRVLVDMQTGGASTSGVKAYVKANLEALTARRRHLGAGLVDYAFFAKPARKVLQWL